VENRETETPAFDRISFTFTGTFPSYAVRWVSQIVADGSGNPIDLEGDGFLQIRFIEADAHDASGSTVASAPPSHVGYAAITGYTQAGDFEGIVSYGVSNYRTVANSNPQPQVRTSEAKSSDGHGGYLYQVSIDIQTQGLGRPGM
jgi:hypothetical protein